MDGLISILIIIGLAAFSSSRKKKKKAQEKATARDRAFKEASQTIEQAKIPFSREEWDALLKAQKPSEDAAKPKAAPAKPRAKPAKPAKPANTAKPANAAKPAEPRPAPVVPAATPALRIEDDAPEGTVSTQGESIAEHAAHVARIHAEESRLLQTQQMLQTLRGLNRQKLRDAVVMSEILGKPVSLRPRGYR